MSWSHEMERTFWQKQTAETPLFPDLLWSRPENKATAGKLLIIGGNTHGFSAAAEAFAEASKAGIGSCRVMLPDGLRKTVGKLFPEAEFAPCTPSGSFARTALAEWLAAAEWADGVLLAGDFGRNSETAIVLETFLKEYTGQLTITKDALDYFLSNPKPVLSCPHTTLVAGFAQLQKLAQNSHFTSAFTFDTDLLRLIDTLHDFTEQSGAAIITKHLDNVFVSVSKRVSSTKLSPDQELWRVKTAAHAAVWQLQNPAKVFEALTTSLL